MVNFEIHVLAEAVTIAIEPNLRNANSDMKPFNTSMFDWNPTVTLGCFAPVQAMKNLMETKPDSSETEDMVSRLFCSHEALYTNFHYACMSGETRGCTWTYLDPWIRMTKYKCSFGSYLFFGLFFPNERICFSSLEAAKPKFRAEICGNICQESNVHFSCQIGTRKSKLDLKKHAISRKKVSIEDPVMRVSQIQRCIRNQFEPVDVVFSAAGKVMMVYETAALIGGYTIEDPGDSIGWHGCN